MPGTSAPSRGTGEPQPAEYTPPSRQLTDGGRAEVRRFFEEALAALDLEELLLGMARSRLFRREYPSAAAMLAGYDDRPPRP